MGKNKHTHESVWDEGVSRRRFLQIMGASLALAGVGGCTRQPPESIVPYVTQPENITPGKVKYYATTLTLAGYGRGALVRSDMGRPTKIEGNPRHPASLGATDLFMQADILTLYDPDRSQNLLRKGGIGTWEQFASMLIREAQGRPGGRGIRLLTGHITSPTLLEQIAAWLRANPEARWHEHEPSEGFERAGTKLAFGRELEPVYHFDRADVIVSLDADFLGEGPGMVAYGRQLIGGRLVRGGRNRMNRLYCAEAMPSITGATADHRWALSPSGIERLAAQLHSALNGGADVPDRVRAIAADLNANRGRSLVVPGPRLGAPAHALAHAMNATLGNNGAAVTFIEPPAGGTDVMDLLDEMGRGEVGVLIMLGCNPAWTLPPEAGFGEKIRKVPQSVHVGLYRDETAVVSQWHVPMRHDLESWGDARAYDGTASLIQPLIEPLYASRSPHEIVALLMGDTGARPYETVRRHWRSLAGEADFEARWEGWLNEGAIANSAPRPVAPTLARKIGTEAPPPQSGIELNVRLDPTVFDGRYANNAWLQECPKPITKLVWDNAAFMSEATAGKLGVENEQLVELKLGPSIVRAPAWIVPGHADGCVTVTLGYGRPWAGVVGNRAGYDAYPLRTFERPWSAAGLSVARAGGRRRLACAQEHHRLDGRRLAREQTLEEFTKNPARVAADELMNPGHAPSLLPKDAYTGNAWAMAIDLTACIGCNACVVACQAENNVPVTGKEQVLRGREMHWLRIDNDSVDDEIVFQPLGCVHCEKAPCELVCPVGATVHDEDGLNLMVYNRCVGTRYCSNNCPYKVRRFNFLQYTDKESESLKLMRNPDVTVRNRGVMEKCTYCVQRIRRARIEADAAGRRIATGEVTTACAAACPTRAIVFGDLNDARSEVGALKREPHGYSLLGHLNTMPRTFYLARVRNPNPALGKTKA
ncbi:MAG: 4Fe-4S dicluster domain-containing protein [Candidatus Sumerlaeia bacterium]